MHPGDYAVEWFLDEGVIPGELSLESGRPPKATLFGDVVLYRGIGAWEVTSLRITLSIASSDGSAPTSMSS